MTAVLVLVMAILAVGVSGQNIVPVDVEVHPGTPSVNIARVIGQLANTFQEISATGSDDFRCKYCELIMAFIYNITTDKALLDEVVKVVKDYVCTYWVPAGFHDYCYNYAEEIPALVESMVNQYLDPKKDCARLCGGTGAADQQNGIIAGLVKKLDGAVPLTYKGP